MNKETLIPELRFPEFKNEGEWNETNLGDIGNFIGGGTPDTTKSEYWNGDIQWYTPTEVKEGKVGKSARTITEEGLRNSSAKLLPKGSLLLTTRATIGDIAIADFECTTNQGFQSLVVKETEANTFWFYWIIQHKNELIKKASGSTFPEIGKNEITKIKALKPKKKEQEKIASCLSSLDETIKAHIQKLELLKNHKKGLMQNLFPQEGETILKYRFKEFENDGDWVVRKLGNVATFLKGKGISKSDIVEKGNLPCIRYGELYTHYKETIDEIKSFTNLGSEELVLSEANDVIIPASGETQIDIATASCVLRSGIALGGDLNIIRSEYDGVFLAYYLNGAKKTDIAQLAQGISVVHLYPSQLQTLSVSFPKNQKEQNKIASCLSSLDAIITEQTEKIEQLKLHKKGLMQGLFPKINN
jgi:type I restriction enzyme S subunit